MAPIWPSYHLLQLSLGAVDATTMGETATHVAALAGVTVVFFFLAMRRLGGSGRGARVDAPSGNLVEQLADQERVTAGHVDACVDESSARVAVQAGPDQFGD